MKKLLQEIKACTICLPYLTNGVRPVLTAHPKSKIIIIGQAPGSIVHKTGIPWDDKSGERLRDWLGVDKKTFYNKEIFAIIPMGFCYPGKGKTGDLPPRKECAPTWHSLLLNQLQEVKLIILIGSYAQNYYLKNPRKTLTETVKNHQIYLPEYMVLPHPSPRNNIWIKKNEWFIKNNIPYLKKIINSIINT
ncbi:uracil-DNA glycosylase family protein [Wenyingzhuangia sp. IMCC45467]